MVNNYGEYKHIVKQQWNNMANGLNVDSALLRPEIKQSWDRSKHYGLVPFDTQVEVLPVERLQLNLIQQNDWFLKIAEDYIKKLYDLVAGTGFLISLCDDKGYMIYWMGDKAILTNAEKISLIPGSNWSEERMGTSGIGLCLATKQPTQILGIEHYLKICHLWTCSAVPILDNGGKFLGILNMSGYLQKNHKHSLGMLVSAGEAISKELESKKAKIYLTVTEQLYHTALDSVSEGIISLNMDGTINYINSIAKELFDISSDRIVSLPEEAYTNLGVDKALTGEQITNKEVNIKLPFKQEKFMVNVCPIRCDEKIIGAITTLRKELEVAQFKQKIRTSTNYVFDDILGESEAIKEALKLAQYAAHFSSNILLVGESGTGKEMFAQAIHNASKQKEGPFVAINCAAIPRELVGSELFGYSEGAFTGARRAGSPGKFELADSGTIFLDEIEDMPLEQQPALLRVLEEKQVTRIGGQRSNPIDVRVISATNQDLLKKMNEKSFRPDLYYRLNVLCIKIPPLRERKEDITFLAEYFLHKFNQELNVNAYFSKNVLNFMENYDWPGNVRELQNVVQQSIFLSGGGIIMREHLQINNISNDTSNDTSSSDPKSLKWKDSQLDSIVKALDQTHGDVVQAATILGISRTTIYRKLKEMNPNHKKTTKYQNTN